MGSRPVSATSSRDPVSNTPTQTSKHSNKDISEWCIRMTSAGQGLKVVLGERHSLHRAELMASLQRRLKDSFGSMSLSALT